MLRTNTILLKPTPEQESTLFTLLEHSARLWNVANYERRQALFKHGMMPNYSGQCKTLKTNEHFKALGTGKSQALLHKLKEAWTAYWELRKMEKEGKLPPHIRKVSPPGYWKGRDGALDPKIIAVRSDCWSMDEEKQTITVSGGLRIPYASGQVLWVGKRGRLEVRYDGVSNRWYAHIPVEVVGNPIIPEQRRRKAAIDIGQCNLIALAIEGAPCPLIWSGRQVLADWQYWTKRIADYEGGLKWMNDKHSSLELSRLYRVRKKRFDHAIRAMVRQLFDILEENDVGYLKFGNLTGIRESIDYGSETNQKLHNFWAYAQISKRICELAEEYGIEVEPVDEKGSSKTCVFHPDEQNGRIHRGLYRCKGFDIVYNADAGGATNLLYGNGKVAAEGTEQSNQPPSGSGLLAQPLLFRWDYQKWGQAPGARTGRPPL